MYPKAFSTLNHHKARTLRGCVGFVSGFVTALILFLKDHPPSLQAIDAVKSTQVCFSPEGNCEKQVIQYIQAATKSVLVMGYSFTSEPIAQALIQAKRRGVVVQVLLDQSQKKGPYSKRAVLTSAHIPVILVQMPGIAHDKVMIIDENITLTGSFNWTRAANKRNSENILFINNKAIAQLYTDHWHKRAVLGTSIKKEKLRRK